MGRAEDAVAPPTAGRAIANSPDEKHKLRYAGKTFEQWRDQLLYDLEPQTEIAAIQALAAFGENGFAEEAAAEIAKALRRKNQQVVQTACNALGGLGKPAVPYLIEALELEMPAVRSVAAQALGQVGPDAAAAVPALLEAARDESRVARMRATQARAKRAPANKNNNAVDQAAAHALGRIGIDDDAHLRDLIELFEDAAPNVRVALLVGFHEHRLNHRDVQFLIAATDAEDESQRARAAAALVHGACDDENVQYAIEQMIHSDTNNVRDHILNNLLNAPQLTGASPLLVACLRSPDLQQRFAPKMPAIMQAIGREGPAAAMATDALIEVVDGDPTESRAADIAAAIDALGSIGPPASKAVPAITAWTETKDLQLDDGDRLSLHAQRALRKITSAEHLHRPSTAEQSRGK